MDINNKGNKHVLEHAFEENKWYRIELTQRKNYNDQKVTLISNRNNAKLNFNTRNQINKCEKAKKAKNIQIPARPDETSQVTTIFRSERISSSYHPTFLRSDQDLQTLLIVNNVCVRNGNDQFVTLILNV